jgi:glycerol-3-phosphate acyltransferase PlsX
MVRYYLKQGFTRNLLTRLAGLFAMPVLNDFRKMLDPRRYNGASLLGLKGIVIKSHGSADVLAYANAIKIAMIAVDTDVPNRISRQVELQLSEGAAK